MKKINLTDALEQIGEEIRKQIFDKKTTISKLSEESGVCRAVVYKVLEGKMYKIDSLLRLTDVLGIKVKLINK